MIASKNVELQDNSSVKLTLTVEKDAVKKEFDSLVSKYAKTVHMKGFRKGKVPASVLIGKFGDSLKGEATMNLMDNALSAALEDLDQKPLPYAQPEVDGEPLIDLESDFTFVVTYDVYPDIKLGTYKGLSIEAPSCSVGKKDIDRELENLQEQNAMVVEKEDGKKVADKDIVTVNYVELDEAGEEIEETRREDFVFTVGTEYNIYKMDKEIIGMVKDQEKVIEKTFSEDYSAEHLAGTTKKIKVKVTMIKVKDLPALDDELAQDISDEYKTLEDLKKSLKKNMTEKAEEKILSLKRDALIEKILETAEIPVPRSMVQAELENSWHNFISQSQLQEEQVLQILQLQNKGKEDLMEEWRESAEKSIKSYLVISKLTEEEKIEVSDEELDGEIKGQAEASKMTFEETKEYLQKNGMTEYLRNDLTTRKLFEALLKETTVKEGKKLSFLDLVS